MITFRLLIEMAQVICCLIIGVHMIDIQQDSSYGFCLCGPVCLSWWHTPLFQLFFCLFFPLGGGVGGASPLCGGVGGASHFNAGVELVDLLSKVVLQLRPLGLQCRGQQAVLHREHLGVQHNVPHLDTHTHTHRHTTLRDKTVYKNSPHSHHPGVPLKRQQP